MKNLLFVSIVLLIGVVLADLHAAGAPIGVLIGILFWIMVGLFVARPR